MSSEATENESHARTLTATENPSNLVAAGDEEAPTRDTLLDTVGSGDEEETPATENETVTGNSSALLSRATADLPVATPVVPTTPEDLEQCRQAQERRRQEHQLQGIQHAVPHDEEAERAKERKESRRQLCVMAVWVVSLALVIGLAVGLTTNSTLSSPAGNEPVDPTPSPSTLDFVELKDLIISVSFDGGASLEDIESPQFQSLKWLENNTYLDDYPDWKRIQRYALGVLYHGTGGEEWFRNEGWMTDIDECDWYSQYQEYSIPLDVCIDGRYAVLRLQKIAMKGMIPAELALLSDALGTYYSLGCLIS